MIGLILAGGSGTRLWPLSRSLYAKQFINFNSDLSLLQQTVEKAVKYCDDVYIVTNDSQYFLVTHQVKKYGLGTDKIIIEPQGKNTAPAIALGIISILESLGQGNILVLPSDHLLDESLFSTASKAEKYCKDNICTFGIKPSFPSTGYGYIKLGKARGDGFVSDGFFEKPDIFTAKKYLESDKYLWNSGIFLFSTSKMVEQFKKYMPNLFVLMDSKDKLIRAYRSLPKTSIDYGIMEKTKDMIVFPFKGGWSDVGSWSSVYNILDKDNEGNAIKADLISIDTHNSLIYGEERLIATIGLKDLIVVDTKDSLLVASVEKSEEVKAVVKELEATNRSEANVHSTVYRPWGHYTVLENGPRYKVKRITVYPEEKLSLQMHHHRAEHWIVVRGTARITQNKEITLVHENESIYVPKSTKHRLENPGKVDLHIIEIQTGEYVEEDDIKRFDDIYNRK